MLSLWERNARSEETCDLRPSILYLCEKVLFSMEREETRRMEKSRMPVTAFYSCSDSSEDIPLLEQLERHLSLLRREGYISTWHRREIVAGSNWQEELDRHLNTASLILLLISSDFLTSDYCYGTEMQRALQRH